MTYDNLANWISSLATLSASVIALYFGLQGNKETRILIQKTENLLDIEAFNFLTSIPQEITGSMDTPANWGLASYTTREFISEFNKKVLANCFLSRKTLKKYNLYINLAEKYSSMNQIRVNTLHQQEKIFNQIKKEAEKLSGKIDSQARITGLKKLWIYESDCFWENNIFYLFKDSLYSDSLSDIIIYSKDKKKSRDIVGEKINKVYLNKDKVICKKISPENYLLIKKSRNQIIIDYKGKIIVLKKNIPYTF